MNYEIRHLSILSFLLSSNKNSDLSIADRDPEEMLEEAEIHGIISLLYDRLCISGPRNDEQLFQLFLNGLKNKNLSSALRTNVIHQEAFDLLNELNTNNIHYVVLKGFALAYDIYSKSYLRPSVDIDILIEDKDIERSKVIFLKKGYQNIKEWEPKEVHLQFTYSKPLLQNITCHWDVHRAISNDHEVSNLLPFSEVYARHSITKVGETWFKSISRPHAFIHASIHFLRHKYRKDTVRLIWLYDLFVLADKMTIAESDELILLVKSKGLANIIMQAIEDTLVHFPSEYLNILKNKVQKLPAGNKLNYLLADSSNGLQRFARQLKSTKSISSAFVLVRETLLPPKEQIYSKYGNVSSKLLWLYYIKRVVSGMVKWVRK